MFWAIFDRTKMTVIASPSTFLIPRTDRGGPPPPPEPPPSFPPSAIRTANFFVGRSRFKSFQKICPKGKFFEMVSWGGLGGFAPFRNLRYLCLAPRGGSGGLRPPGISVNYPCLASAAAVPCPRALPPIFFRPNFFVGIFSSEFFRRNFFVGIFLSEFFCLNFFQRF